MRSTGRDDLPAADERAPREVRLPGPPASDPRLEHFHTTRHASPRHRAIPPELGVVGSPWLARFDWVLDARLDAPPGDDGELVLTRLRDEPGAVFCKAGKCHAFMDHVLPRLERPVVLYVGNGQLGLSHQGGAVRRLVAHPLIRHVFAENRDLAVPRVTAMPVGLHPADLLLAGAHRIREYSARPATRRRARVLVLGESPGRLASALDADAGPLGSCFRPSPPFRSTIARWRELSAHRFALIGWGSGLDSPGIFEALAVGTVPILEDTPVADAYDGLPVVRIRDLSEITPGALDRWWTALAPAFDDPGFLAPGFWWRRVVRRLERPKRAFLVLGPESHGTHLVTDLLVQAGCHGHSGKHASWHGAVDTSLSDRQPWDDAPPTGEDPVVWRRSVPHQARWPDIAGMIADLEARGYGVTAVVVHRDRVAAVRSQLKWRHVLDEDSARAHIDRAYRHIYAHLERADVPSILVGYEALVTYPRARRQLLTDLGLPPAAEKMELWDGNAKWHESVDEDVRAEPVIEAQPRIAFPEHWFVPDPDRWEAYEQAIDRGRQRMAESRVVVCGLARNIATTLPEVRARVEQLGARFADYRVVIVENDSADGTAELLAAWAASNPRVRTVHETLGWPVWSRSTDAQRMAAMAHARNRCLDQVAELGQQVDHVVVFDFDLHRGCSLDGLASTFGAGAWDVVGSNGLVVPLDGPLPGAPMFFDAWSFRPADDPRPQPFEMVNRLHLVRGEPLLPVTSCFGGLAVYARDAFLCGARYGGEDCEHVVFHRSLAERGYRRIFLNPSQIVLYDPESGDERAASS